MQPGDEAFGAHEPMDHELESGAPAPLRAERADSRPLSSAPEAPVPALGYASGRGHAGSDHADLVQQATAIEAFCASRGWKLVGLVRDVQPSSRRGPGRPSLDYTLGRLRSGDATCLVVADLKRLSPSVADLGDVLDAVEQAGARLVALEPGIDTGTRLGRASLSVVRSVIRWERARRTEMTAAARAKAATLTTIDPSLKRRIRRMRGAGLTLQAISDALNEDRVPTVRGGIEWRPSSVQTALGYRRPRV
jgi:DNA invertase Pin-like site-specific DNA recombinase